jgi:pimeloyl-ACP methyl ester carboxylesterase
MASRPAASALLLAGTLIGGCASEAAREPPLHTVQVGDRSDTLVVMLPGIKDPAEQFLVEGFVGGDGAGESFDVVVVEPELGDYLRGTIVEQLRTEVIGPARARGYDDIWLVGVSIGGYGSLLYAGEFPAEIAGVVLLAPYLGGRRVPRAIAAAGGLEAWQAAHSSPFVDGWVALQTLLRRSDATIVLGFGGDDRLAETYEPLLAALPRSQVYTVDGDHGWATWAPLWQEIKPTIVSAARANSAARLAAP